jgi:hypothetical protein
MTTYKTVVHIEDSTELAKMKDAGYNLFAFKAVKSSAKGAPTVWFETGNYLKNTSISWEQKYQAYISGDELQADVTILASNYENMDLGWVMDVDPNGNCKVDPNGPVKTGISVYDEQGGEEWTCGISTKVGDQFNILCAFPLYQDNLIAMQPIEKVLLIFATDKITTGTVKMQAFGPGILIDLTGAPQNTRTVDYSLSSGWNWEGSWARRVSPKSDLNPLLIEFDTDLQKYALKSAGERGR